MSRQAKIQPLLTALLLLALVATLPACAPLPPPEAPPAEPKSEAPASAPTPAEAPPPPQKNPWEGRDDLIQAPKPEKPSPLDLGKVERRRLRNGLRVLLMPERTLPLVSVRLVLQAGSADDPAGKVGLADFTFDMLRQGTKGYTADALSAKVDAAGASLGAGAGYELGQVRCGGRTQTLELCLEMVAELVLHPTFPEGEMGEVRDGLLGMIKQRRDDPATLARAHFFNRLYGDDHPGGRPMTEAGVRGIGREDLRRFHGARFRPGSAMLGISGDIEPKQAMALVRRFFRGWKRGKAPARRIKPLAPVTSPPSLLLVDKPDLNQAFFSQGHAGISRRDPRRYATLVMNHVLGGGGFSSRLMKVVRAEGGKTYGISSTFDMDTADGNFRVSSFTRSAQLTAMLRMVRGELARMVKTPPDADELLAARGKMAGSYPVSLQTAGRRLSALLRAELLGFDRRYVTHYPLDVFGVSAEQAARAARELLHPEHLVTVVVGQAAALQDQLRAAGIAFETISYLAPISAAERKALGGKPKIAPAQRRRARALLEQLLRGSGGQKALAAVRSLRLKGKAETAGRRVAGTLSSALLLPDQWRQELHFPPVRMVQVLAGEGGFAQVSRDGVKEKVERRALPPDKVAAMKRKLWRHPLLLPLHALQPGVEARPLEAQERGRKAVQVFPPDGAPPLTLVLAPVGSGARGMRLVQVRTRDASGAEVVVELSDHRRVDGLLVPHTVTTRAPGRPESVVSYEQVTINPKLTKAEISAAK